MAIDAFDPFAMSRQLASYDKYLFKAQELENQGLTSICKVLLPNQEIPTPKYYKIEAITEQI